MSDQDNGTWVEYRRLVLRELKSLNEDLDKISARVQVLEVGPIRIEQIQGTIDEMRGAVRELEREVSDYPEVKRRAAANEKRSQLNRDDLLKIKIKVALIGAACGAVFSFFVSWVLPKIFGGP